MLTLELFTNDVLDSWPELLHKSERQLQIAVMRAMNKTLRWARTQVARTSATSLKINVKSVKKGLVMVRASPSRLDATLGLSASAGVIKGNDIGAPRQHVRGVRAGRHRFDGAFIARMPSGHQGIFRRQSKARLPIREVQLVLTGKMQDEMAALVDGPLKAQFERLLVRELRYMAGIDNG